MSADYTEQRFDYSLGREGAPELVVMVGVSGSGKSVAAKSWVNWGEGNVVRLNKDNLRSMIYVDVPWAAHKDDMIRILERDMARTLLKHGRNVIIDDTNCVRRTRAAWEQLAQEMRVKLRIVTMTTPKEVCIERDATRPGKECVGRDVIIKQFKDLHKLSMTTETNPVLTRPVFEKNALLTGGWTVRLPDADWVIVDVDGTLADHTGVRNSYDESRVIHDNPYPVVVEWVQELYPFYNVAIFSGRKEKCGDDTCDWLVMQGVPFDHILMRCTSDNRSDEFVKKDLLDMFLEVVPKEKLAFVLDDRPRVCKMWRANGLTVYPVRGTTDHTPACPKDGDEPKLTCPHCGALGDF